jgi:GT2 family glycosyltransferase
MDVSVIIVNTNTKALLKQCLKSLFEQTQDIAFEVIVVDNSSHDGSSQMVREEFPNVILAESENKGFGHANNVGAKYAKGKYLFLLNPDTIVRNNAVKILFDFIDTHPKAGICGGNLFDEDGNPGYSYNMLLPSILWELNSFCRILDSIYGKNKYFNHTGKPLKIKGYITGADLMINTDLFKQLGGFDTDFFVYFEETELAFRVKKIGYTLYSVPQAEIIHLEGKTFLDNNEKKLEIFMSSRKKYYQKTHNTFTTTICNYIFLMTLLIRLSFFFLTKTNTKKYNYYKSQLVVFRKYFKK